MGENKRERAEWEARALPSQEQRRLDREAARERAAQVRAQLSTAQQIAEWALRDVLDAGEPVRLIVEPDGLGGARFTLKTVQGVSTSRRGVYMHGVVKNDGDVSETLLRILEKGDWRVDQYWVP